MAPPEKKAKTEAKVKAPEPQAKAQKEDAPKQTEEAKEPVEAAVKAEEAKEELETDCGNLKEDKRSSEHVRFQTCDTTLNVLQSTTSNILMCVSEGGLQHFIAGARANVGIHRGRYFWEVKIVEGLENGPKATKPTLRVGVSTAGSDLVLGCAAGGFAFDSDGGIFQEGKRLPTGGHRIHKNAVIGILLNLEEKTTNFNTISLFLDGKRMTQPKPLPEELKGKNLFPHLSFRGMTVAVNFGPSPIAPLPFRCHMLQNGAQAHLVFSKSPATDGELHVPVCLPDEGTFDWLDLFKEQHPKFTELSNRAFADWARKSGLLVQPGKSSNDQSDTIRDVDEASLHRAVLNVAPLQPRNYLLMEVRRNLLKAERQATLKPFANTAFTKKALVIMGEPTSDFRKRTHATMLKVKQAESDRQFALKKVQEKQAKLAERRKKEIERKKRKNMREAKRRAREIKKKAMEAKRAKEIEEGKEPTEDNVEEEEEPLEDSSEEEPVDEPEEDQEPPKVELTPEEEAVLFPTHPIKDLTAQTLSASFGQFTIPEKDEGFDDISFEWNKLEKSREYLRKWILERKVKLRVEDLNPGTWSIKMLQEWRKCEATWKEAQRKYKEKVAERLAKLAKKESLKRKAAMIKKDEKDGMEDTSEEKEDDEAKEESDVEPEPVIDFANLDVYGIDNILDLGGKVPLFRDWQPADWALMQLRFELHLLAHSFQKDVNDPDRPGILMDHMLFYYQKYFKKGLNLKDWGADTCEDLVKLVGDIVYFSPDKVLLPMLADDWESLAVFPKLTEDARRHRLLRIDLGEDAARLKISMKVLNNFIITSKPPPKQWPAQTQKGWGTGGAQPQQQQQQQAVDAAKKWAAKKPLQVQRPLPGTPAKAGGVVAKAIAGKAPAAKALVPAKAAGALVPAKAKAKGMLAKPAGVTTPKAGLVRPMGSVPQASAKLLPKATAVGTTVPPKVGKAGIVPVLTAAAPKAALAPPGNSSGFVATGGLGKGPASPALGKGTATTSMGGKGKDSSWQPSTSWGKGAASASGSWSGSQAQTSSFVKSQEKGGGKSGKDGSSGKDTGKPSFGSSSGSLGGKSAGKDTWGGSNSTPLGKDSNWSSGGGKGSSWSAGGKDSGWGSGGSGSKEPNKGSSGSFGGGNDFGKDSWSSGSKGPMSYGAGKSGCGSGGKDSGKGSFGAPSANSFGAGGASSFGGCCGGSLVGGKSAGKASGKDSWSGAGGVWSKGGRW